MKFDLNPLPQLALEAEQQVNEHFNDLAHQSAQRDAEHASKRAAAQQTEPPAWFCEAAAIEGMTVNEFAAAVLAKPNEAAQRGILRRQAIVTIRSARSVEIIDAALDQAGLPAD